MFRWCRILLCFRLCNIAAGISSGVEVMNTAVPGTRVASRDSATIIGASGKAVSLRCCAIRLRPRFQVVMNTNTTKAITIGNQPPSGILIAVDANSAISTIKNRQNNRPDDTRFHFHKPMATTANSTVSMSIAPVTARPYAAARFDVLRKAITTINTSTNNVQLIAGR